MHAHTFATQERTLAPSQILRGVAGSCATAKGAKAPSFTRRGSLCPASWGGEDKRYPRPGMDRSGPDSTVDFGSLVEGGPV
jgi:hypothetical protein